MAIGSYASGPNDYLNPSNKEVVTAQGCLPFNSQYWWFDTTGRIRSYVDPSKCVEAGGSETLWAKLFLFDCHDGLHQKWEWREDGRLWNKKISYCIGQAHCSNNVGTESLEFHPAIDSNDYCKLSQTWAYQD